jgi:bromodomain and PHD finger-containing protein 1
MCVQEETSNNRKKANLNTSTSSLADVRKCVYCDIHTPLDVLSPQTQKKIKRKNGNSLNWNDSVACEEALKQAQKERMKRARKILAEKRNAAPVVSIPVIPPDRIQEIMNQIDDYLFEKEKFFKTLMSYWQIKRYSRNGVPLLRRLQNTAGIVKKNNDFKSQKAQIEHNKAVDLSSDDFEKYKEKTKEQLTYMKKLRQDLERARLLMELIRKRERIKRENVLIHQMIATFEMNPFNMLLQRLLDNLIDLDKGRIFVDPVDINQVPNYLDEIKEPMDFSTMQKKLLDHVYTKFELFEADFNLIISNCLTFNQKNSFYYKAAFKLREQVIINISLFFYVFKLIIVESISINSRHRV